MWGGTRVGLERGFFLPDMWPEVTVLQQRLHRSSDVKIYYIDPCSQTDSQGQSVPLQRFAHVCTHTHAHTLYLGRLISGLFFLENST